VAVAADYNFVLGLVLGFTLTIPPGPMNAFIASNSLRSWRAGFTAGTGAMSADACLGILVFFLRGTVNLTDYVRAIYGVGAGVTLLYAVLLLRSRFQPPPAMPSGMRVYSQSLLLGLGNPFQILWWLTAGLAFAYLGGIILFGGLFSAIAIWILVFPFLVNRGVQNHPLVQSSVVGISEALLLAFAAYFFYLAW
jgi:threonine/homoserine/homoserine lactone efflux protein